MEEQQKIPQATAKRLPLYYRYLENLYGSGKLRVSSTELSEAVKIDSATIRRDFSYFGALGRKGYGYDVHYLLSFFRKTLDQDETTHVILVGVGNLGKALLNYNFAKNNNTQIVRAFDNDHSLVGHEIGGVTISHMDELDEKVTTDIKAAILAVPSAVAQTVADRLANTGIQGIMNFTPTRLSVPDHIRLHRIDLSIELQSLIYFLKHYPLQTK
ncbi:redox-sensitive transcriptional regulator [Geomicrobium sp. JCM 19037]|uniref:redox-sensing transcriptional repressor Rex n=1 Tax=Geomicrobium sp. JCM 19037 TaxID=1460634 RepID=UPI00045F134A|nr:redox-sensing transcriptional repressor Rex [Geomicrobium sp. JCM 19037]GAK05116.1 redox-sensitive transcriptional regulator [Geomicrobium sp. JCM 19037]